MKKILFIGSVFMLLVDLTSPFLGAQAFKQSKSRSLLTAKAPNLKVQNVGFSPTNFNDGGTVTIRYQILNNGSVASKRFMSTFQITRYLKKNQLINSLNPGQTITIQHTFKARCGKQEWSVMADSRGVIGESNEGDNIWKKNLNISCRGLPYLAVHGVRFTHPFNQNDKVHFTYTIENRGKCWAPPTVAHFVVDGRIKAAHKVRALHRFEKVTLATDWQATCKGAKISIISDALNRVEETNEARKQSWEKTMRCAGGDPASKPDLVVEKVEIIPSTRQLFAKDKVKVRVTVRNIAGDCRSGEAGACTLYWNIRGQTKPMHSHLERINLPKISSPCYGTSNNFKLIEREYPAGLYPQSYVFTLQVDSADKVKEGNENNNKKVIRFMVRPEKKADLAITHLYSPDPTRYVGQKIIVKGTIRNLGLKKSSTCQLDMKCYKNKYRKTQVKELKPGGEFHFAFSFRWATRGSKKCEVWVDKNNQVPENTKVNNYRIYTKIRIK